MDTLTNFNLAALENVAALEKNSFMLLLQLHFSIPLLFLCPSINTRGKHSLYPKPLFPVHLCSIMDLLKDGSYKFMFYTQALRTLRKVGRYIHNMSSLLPCVMIPNFLCLLPQPQSSPNQNALSITQLQSSAYRLELIDEIMSLLWLAVGWKVLPLNRKVSK